MQAIQHTSYEPTIKGHELNNDDPHLQELTLVLIHQLEKTSLVTTSPPPVPLIVCSTTEYTINAGLNITAVTGEHIEARRNYLCAKEIGFSNILRNQIQLCNGYHKIGSTPQDMDKKTSTLRSHLPEQVKKPEVFAGLEIKPCYPKNQNDTNSATAHHYYLFLQSERLSVPQPCTAGPQRYSCSWQDSCSTRFS